jgi:rsbT antagonist protein RsbS
MAASADRQIPLQVSRGCVVAAIQVDLDEDVMRQFRQDLLGRVRDTRAHGVVLDLSGLQVLDRDDFEQLRLTMDMVAVLGAHPVIAGLRPGVVSALVDLGAEVDHVSAAFNLDEAFRLLEARRPGI